QPESSSIPIITPDETEAVATPSITFDESQAMTTPVLTLDEMHTVTTSNINDISMRKKSKQHENETLSNNNAQALGNNDIGLFVNKSCISTNEIYAVLIDPWKPSTQYEFPQVNMNQKVRSVCQHSWLLSYPWLGYFHTLEGVLCRYCILFQRKWSAKDPGKNALGQLVVKPLTSLNKAHDYFRSHEKTDYHLFSKEQAKLFIISYTDPSKSIDRILDNEYQQQEAMNRKILASIIKCILFIGKQNLAFRGHDDDGIDYKSTEGLVDATSDITGTEQMSLSVRYLCHAGDQIAIKEDFIGFISITDNSAKGLSEHIISFLQSVGLDLAYLRGQEYNGCTVMSGDISGVQKLILDIAPKALYVHCASHSLDLAICDACDDRYIQLFFGTLKAIIKFISKSPKKQKLLKNAIEATHSDMKRKKLAKLIEHQYMVENADSDTSAKSHAYLKSIKDLDFVVCLFVVSRVFAILKPYTEMLQSKNCDLTQCYNNIQEVALHLVELKYDEKKINELANDLKIFSHDNDITFEISRTNKF
ncbi:unnamed protein product, partial [Rotaria sp. Silwood1]